LATLECDSKELVVYEARSDKVGLEPKVRGEPKCLSERHRVVHGSIFAPSSIPSAESTR
jgi:hypothetical protein